MFIYVGLNCLNVLLINSQPQIGFIEITPELRNQGIEFIALVVRTVYGSLFRYENTIFPSHGYCIVSL